jgi:hypothetical protein
MTQVAHHRHQWLCISAFPSAHSPKARLVFTVFVPLMRLLIYGVIFTKVSGLAPNFYETRKKQWITDVGGHGRGHGTEVLWHTGRSVSSAHADDGETWDTSPSTPRAVSLRVLHVCVHVARWCRGQRGRTYTHPHVSTETARSGM